LKIIAVEEHFYTESFYQYLVSKSDKLTRKFPASIALLKELGDSRLKEMDKYGITTQVLSLSQPGVEDLELAEGIEWARRTNDDVGAWAKKYPERYIGFASLPVQDPKAAADELQRCVTKVGLKGATIHSHYQNDYFDQKKYRVIFDTAVRLNVPIYIHPMQPSTDMIKPYLAYPGLERAMAGYGADTFLCALRMILSGIFDEYPKLHIILGHLGEALPFWQWRVENIFSRQRNAPKLNRKISEYLKDNFYYSTSGMFSVPALMGVYMTSGADNILFAVDYPHEFNEPAIKFMEAAPICPSDKEKIYHINAEKLLSL
jgi:predicted TIM-barrel fold metal-dependent hydrolase